MNITTIVSEIRTPGKPVFKRSSLPSASAPKKPFQPFPPGTIRGPFICGKGTDPEGGVQFAVSLQDGSWAYYIRAKYEEKEAREQAEERAKQVLANNK